MVDWLDRGDTPWDLALKDYIDAIAAGVTGVSLVNGNVIFTLADGTTKNLGPLTGATNANFAAYITGTGPTRDALSNSYAHPVSTDGTNGLPAPSGVGVEMVITAAGLQDIRLNGVSL